MIREEDRYTNVSGLREPLYYRGTLGHKIFSTTLVPSEGRTPVFIRQLSDGALNAPQFESAGVLPTLTEGSYEEPLQVTE